MRKKNNIAGHFDRLVQLLSGIGNQLLIKLCPGMINSKLDVVRAEFIPNFIPMIQIPPKLEHMNSSKQFDVYNFSTNSISHVIFELLDNSTCDWMTRVS